MANPNGRLTSRRRTDQRRLERHHSVLAGYLFDVTRDYATAMLIAVGANLVGIAMAMTIPKRGWREKS